MKLGIIGFGNLGRSLCGGLLFSGVRPEDILVYNRTASVCDTAREKYGVDASGDLAHVISGSDVVFLVVKGYVYEELALRFDNSLDAGKTVISFMAGVSPERLRGLCGDSAEIVVAIPTVSIASCSGIIAHTSARKPIAELLSKLGYAFEAPYDNVVKAAAYAACGLGFAAYLLDAYAQAGKALGFSDEECGRITGILFRTALLRGDFKTLVSEVATKGGATERGVAHMDATQLPETVATAIRLAYDKMK